MARVRVCASFARSRFRSHILPHFPVKVDYGESFHFCDDPVCPDPRPEAVKHLAVRTGLDSEPPRAARTPAGHLRGPGLPGDEDDRRGGEGRPAFRDMG